MSTLRRVDGTFDVPGELPVIALRDLVFFPYHVLPLTIGRRPSLAALRVAESEGGLALLVAQRGMAVEEPGRDHLHQAGTIARVVNVTRDVQGRTRAVMDGLGRARIAEFVPSGAGFRASVELLAKSECDEAEGGLEARIRARALDVLRLFRRYVQLSELISNELIGAIERITDRVRLSHLVAGHLRVGCDEKQAVLETVDLGARLQLLYGLLEREVEVLDIQKRLDEQIRMEMRGEGGLEGEETDGWDGGRGGGGPGRGDSGSGRRAGGRRGRESGGGGRRPGGRGRPWEPMDPEWKELEAALEAAPLPLHARRRADTEFKRLCKLNPFAPEASVVRTYLDWILALPWERETKDSIDVAGASEVLEKQHYGLDEVKDRILDHIAVLSLVGRMQGPILCLVGPPGVGKTSLAGSIAGALGREFMRVSLGGVRDEADIRGHRRTYVGAQPGRIIRGLRDGKSRNPVILLDEIDKLMSEFHGDPGAALLEVLDPEQNRSFTDHYLELGFDLSNVLFVTTANTLGAVPGPLRDRMEVIRLPGYLDTEKREIAKRFLWPGQVEGNGLSDLAPEITDEAVHVVISEYTREAGVRELERRLSTVARKLARGLAEEGPQRLGPVDAASVRAMLGPPAHQAPRREEGEDRAGIACGLAWTAVGGEVLEVEVSVVPGSGEIELTGTLGDVMKESAKAAVTYARSRARWLGLEERFHRNVDLHIHIPEGATPKDGPSAGITIAVALISALTDTPTRADLAMTGEITLRGRVLAVGGIKEKAVAALRGGIRRVLLPAANATDIERLPEEVRAGVELVPVETMDQVLREALVARTRDAADAFGDPGAARAT